MDLPGTDSWQMANPIMLMFFIGFAVKYQFSHCMVGYPTDAQAPTAGSVDLAGILIKIQAYGLLRFVLPLFPEASAQFETIAITSMVLVFLWAICVYARYRWLLAYTWYFSHMGFVYCVVCRYK